MDFQDLPEKDPPASGKDLSSEDEAAIVQTDKESPLDEDTTLTPEENSKNKKHGILDKLKTLKSLASPKTLSSKISSKLSTAFKGKGLKELKAYLPAFGALLIPLCFLLYYQLILQPKAQNEKEFSDFLNSVLIFVRAEENSYPPPPESILYAKYLSPNSRLLQKGLVSFFKGDYEDARLILSILEDNNPSLKRLYPIMGATHQRAGNFSMARDYFLKSLDLYSTFPFDQGDLQSVIEIGLALSYVNLLDLDSALPYAKQAYEERLTSKGLTSTETQSAANILAPILIGLGQNLEGEKILEDSVKAALKNGLDPGSTLMVDSLNLLSFSYSLSENGKDIYALFKKPEDPPIKAPRAASLLNPEPVNTSSEEQAEDSFAKEEDTTNSSQTLDPAFNFPAALSIYNDLTKLSPQSPLRAELLRSMIEALAPATPLCKDPGDVNFRGSLWYLCVDLADSMIDAYYSPNSLSFAENLLFWREMSYENRAYLIYEILAIEKTYEGDLPSAIDYLRKALALLHNKESLSQNEQSYLILRSITLADLLLIEKNPPIESEIVLMAAINTLERTLSKKERESSLEIPFLYWYLARHLRDQSRSKDSRSNFQKAERAVTQLNKLNPDKENELQRLQTMIKDDRDYKAGKNAKEAPRFPNSPKIFYPAFLEANKNANLRTSPPSTMRIELEALKFLGRINEFQPMIDRAINQTEANSPERLRYESLKLKYLEEVGDNTGLFQELTRLYNNPQGADDSTKTLFQSSVKAYEGRVYFRQGNKSLAKSAYESALDLLSKVPGTEERQNEIRKELELITSNPKAF